MVWEEGRRHAAILWVADASWGSDCRDESGAVGEKAPMKVEERSVRGWERVMLEGGAEDGGGGVGERGRFWDM